MYLVFEVLHLLLGRDATSLALLDLSVGVLQFLEEVVQFLLRGPLRLESLAQLLCDPGEVQYRTLHRLEPEKSLNSVAYLIANLVLDQGFDALTVDEEKTAETLGQHVAEVSIGVTQRFEVAIPFTSPQLEARFRPRLDCAVLGRMNRPLQDVGHSAVFELDSNCSSQGSPFGGTIPHCSVNQLIFVLDIVAEHSIESPGEGVQEGGLAATIGTPQDSDVGLRRLSEANLLNTLIRAEVLKFDGDEPHYTMPSTFFTISSRTAFRAVGSGLWRYSCSSAVTILMTS